MTTPANTPYAPKTLADCATEFRAMMEDAIKRNEFEAAATCKTFLHAVEAAERANAALSAENAGLRALVPEVEKLRDSSRAYLQLGGEFGYSAAHTDTSETVRLNALLDAARSTRPKSHPEGDA